MNKKNRVVKPAKHSNMQRVHKWEGGPVTGMLTGMFLGCAL